MSADRTVEFCKKSSEEEISEISADRTVEFCERFSGEEISKMSADRTVEFCEEILRRRDQWNISRQNIGVL